MSECRFLYENLVDGPGGLAVSSAAPGAVGTPAPEALGSAVCYAGGSHTGRQDQVFVVEIDGEGVDGAVGNATFRWRRASAEGWEASGVPTATAFIPLADGVAVKWAGGAGQELYKGDRWSLLAVGRHGEQPLCDRDRDTRWQAQGCAAEWVGVELDQAARVQAVVLGDHNLSEAATAVLKGSDTPEPGEALWSFDPAGGVLADGAGNPGSNGRSTGRTYLDNGVLGYAGPGESCFEDGELSIQPAASNLVIYSERLDNAAWTPSAYAEVSANAAAAPDGEATADKLIAGAQAGASFVLRSPNLVLDDDEHYVVSIFARPAEITWLRVQPQAKDSSLPSTYFDLASQVVGSSTALAAGIEDIGSGWVRVWVRFNSQSGATTPLFRVQLANGDGQGVFDGDGSSGLYLWGAQIEQGNVPTAYIPTVASTASRGADAVRWDLPAALRDILSIAEGEASAQGTLVVRGWVPGFDHDAVPNDYYPILGPHETKYALLSCRGASGLIYSDCGSTAAYVTNHWLAGQSYDLAVRWDSAANLLQVGYKLSAASTWTWGSSATFDGSFVLGSYLNLGYDPDYPFRIGGNLELHGSWLGDPLEQSLYPWEHPEYEQALSLTRPHLVGFLDQTHKYWRLELCDPANPAGSLGASLFYLGGSFAPERTFAAGYTQGTVAGRRLTTSAAGKVAGNATALAVFYELSFPRLSAADAAAMEAMMAAIHDHASGGLRPILFTPFSDDPAGTLYCLPEASLTRRRLAGGRWELGLRLEEVVRTDV